MNDNLNLINSRLHGHELLGQAEAWRRAGAAATAPSPAPTLARTVVIRSAEQTDGEALRRLAQLEGRWLRPSPRVLVAEVDGEVQAALPLGGEAFADPFRHTAALVEMLKLRAAGLDRRPEPQQRRGLRSLLATIRPARRRATSASATPCL